MQATIVKPALLCAALLVSLASSAAEPVAAPPAATPAAPPPRPQLPTTATNCEVRRISQGQYFTETAFDLVRVLPPPPAADSAAQRTDLEAVLAAQREARRTNQTARGIADAALTCKRVAIALGMELSEARTPRALAFLERVANVATTATNQGKDYWSRPRPFMVSNAVERLADKAVIPPGTTPPPVTPPFPFNFTLPSAAACTALETGAPPPAAAAAAGAAGAARGGGAPAAAQPGPPPPDWRDDFRSYPSGHSAFGYACGVVLADMVPEKRSDLMARAIEYGQSRLIVGAHFATDVEQGRAASALALAEMEGNAAYRRDFEIARRELRDALGLPAAAPNVRPPSPKPPQPAP